ncbi:MAG: prepilin-type N-terminal cleavage/methylation domain-containing protein [Patescibacteria group bacterium]|nr:prepilin-type N-terminal cleavage/methylation domain-containing protein [Patescibacteria group bacterium]
MPFSNKKAFTLIEILIVLAIISIIIAIFVVVSKPADILQKSRDTSRLRDLKKTEEIILLMFNHNDKFDAASYIFPNTVYLSLRDTSSTCASHLSQLPSLPSGWSYRCSATPTAMNGQGWLPIPFSSNPLINLDRLPIDPINKPPYYYTFVLSEKFYELTALKEKKEEEIIVYNSKIRLTPISRGGTWLKTWAGQDHDIPRVVYQTNDGGYFVFGNTYSCCGGNYDIFVLKLDSGGNYQWIKTIGDAYWDIVYSVVNTSDGGFLLAGYTSSYGSINGDVFLVKLSSQGNIVWSKRLGSSNQEYIYDIKKINGGYIAVGYTSSGNGDILLIRLNNNGDIVWSRAIGGSGVDDGYFIEDLSDDYYLIGGKFSSLGVDTALIKIDGGGSIVWAKGLSAVDEVIWKKAEDLGNEYLVVGRIDSQTFGGQGNNEVIILNFATSGSLNWTKIIGDNQSNEIRTMIKTQDDNYLLLGNNIIKISLSGDVLWAKSLLNKFYFLYSGYQNFDGSYLIAGYYDNSPISNYDISLFKLSSKGEISSCPFLTNASLSSLSPNINLLNISPSNYPITLSNYSVNIPNTPGFTLEITNFCPAY